MPHGDAPQGAAQQPAGAAAAGAAPAAATAQVVTSPTGSTLSSYEELTFLPEDFELPAGALSEVDRSSPASPDDVFRCPSCTAPECMVGGTHMVYGG